MNWKDTVNASIERYPTLYLRDTWEKSAFDVAHHYFVVLGNGLEWANTKDPSKGGYLIYPRNHRRNGDWQRNIDPPYRHRSRIRLDWNIFDPNMKKYSISRIDHEASEECKSYIREKRDRSRNHVRKLYTEKEMVAVFDLNKTLILDEKDLFLRYNKELHKDYTWVAERISEKEDIARQSREEGGPYPNFDKKYSCFWEINSSLIKPDWKEAGLAHLRFWKTWFDDESNHKKYSYCPYNPRNQRGDTIEERIRKYHPEYLELPRDEFVRKIQTEYKCPIFNGYNWDDLISYNWRKHLAEVKTYLTETINRLS